MKIPIFHWSLEYSLRFYGLWPGQSFWLNQIILCSTLILVSPFQFYAMYVHYKSAPLIMDAFRDGATDLLLVLKFILMRYNQRYITLLLEEINDDWEKLTDREDKEIMIKYSEYAHKFCIVDWSFYLFTSFGYFSSFSMSYFTQREEKVLFISAEYPFNFHHSPSYEIINGIQMILFCTWVVGDALSETLLGTFIFHVAGNVEILIKDISKMSSIGKVANYNQLLNVIKNIVNKHRKLIDMRQKIETVFTYVCLIQFFSSTLVICTTGFLILITAGVTDSFSYFKFIIFILLMLWQAFAFCFAGEFLLTKSSNIPLSISACSWYDMSPKTVKLLLIIMVRTQQPLQLTIGKFATLSIGSFTTILKTSGSYLSVLRTTY